MDWVYPPTCVICGMHGYTICSSCKNEIQFITEKICPICGGLLRYKIPCCQDCNRNIPAFDAARSLGIYGGVLRESIHALKYENRRGLGNYFAKLLSPVVEKEGWSIDTVIPVPISQRRLKDRGYNQAADIARPLALLLERPFQPYGLKQVLDIKSQVGLSADARRLNVVDAFVAVPELVSEKSILLVDDVMTTGATLDSCASALKKGGSGKVFCVTIARFSG